MHHIVFLFTGEKIRRLQGLKVAAVTVMLITIMTACTPTTSATMTASMPTASVDQVPLPAVIKQAAIGGALDANGLNGDQHFTGIVATTIGNTAVYRAPVYSTQFATLAGGMAFPVTEAPAVDGWIHVMLPSQTTDGHGNATGWVRKEDVTTTTGGNRVIIDAAKLAVSVVDVNGTQLASWPARVGRFVGSGSTFVNSYLDVPTEWQSCGQAKSAALAMPGTDSRHPFTTIVGLSGTCHYSSTDLTSATPYAAELSPESAQQLAILAPPGTWVDVKAGSSMMSGATA